MKIHIVGKDERLRVCAALLEEKPPRGHGAIKLLPIPVSKDGKCINGTDKSFSELAKECEVGEIVVAFSAHPQLRKCVLEEGAILIDPELDGAFVSANANLTAIGALGRILTEERAAPCQLKFGIIGYGRIGQALVRLLMFVGASVRVFTSKEELRRDLQMLGISGVDSCNLTENLSSLSDLDLLINTAPAPLLTDGCAEMLENTRVIELASGKNLPPSIPHEIWSSIPANMYPRSAGEELYRSIMRMLT